MAATSNLLPLEISSPISIVAGLISKPYHHRFRLQALTSSSGYRYQFLVVCNPSNVAIQLAKQRSGFVSVVPMFNRTELNR
ncbi:hypothetical protein F8388_003311 [Cannabis sativa]|uniref:Uncharacterized protein n=1 Tax=Cannabis sativa TaxID=3483 RepID=A0A7J6EFS1_CANSA|nr:hypothetical protein G4B88_003580 [Cannabis sativa]KAF4357164.1 hypothetical protein F8388_003311 [Cannabis sativa]